MYSQSTDLKILKERNPPLGDRPGWPQPGGVPPCNQSQQAPLLSACFWRVKIPEQCISASATAGSIVSGTGVPEYVSTMNHKQRDN